MNNQFSTVSVIGGSHTSIGEFQLEVLKAVCILGKNAYRWNITEYLSETLKKQYETPQTYQALKTLMRKNLLTAKVNSKKGKQARGRPRKIYSLTIQSQELLKNPYHWKNSTNQVTSTLPRPK